MQRFKFQALVTPSADDDDDARAKLSSGSHRMVLRAVNSETRRSQVFSALVDGEDDGPFRAGSPQIMVTLRVVGDDVSDYLRHRQPLQPLARERYRTGCRDPSPASVDSGLVTTRVQRWPLPHQFAPAGELLPATRRALIHRVAAGQAEGRTPSLVGAVVRDGIQAWCGARSMLEGHEPDGDTQYRIGSLTKTFIAVLVMRLRDEGRLDLADPLGKHLDAGQAASVTIAQLLSHTAGLASETPGPWWERSPGDLRPALADILGPARHPAGRLFHYSNPGYGLLGALVGQLRGHGWEQALRQEILDPLGMARTTVSPEPPHARGFAVHPWADVMQLEPAEGTGLMAPAGELWSTAADLCRFAAFLLDGDDRVLPAKTLAEMRTPAAPPGDDAWASGYGLGLQLFRHDGRVFYGHSGSMPGFLATLCVSPADGLGGVALANVTSGPTSPRSPSTW